MTLHIDENECTKLGLSIDTALYLAALYYNKPITRNAFYDACEFGYMVYDGFDIANNPINPRLTESGVEAIESAFLNSEFKPKNVGIDSFKRLAEKLRELYPAGKKPGTSYMWKDSISVITLRLKALVKKFNAKFTEEQAIEATKKYIDSFNGNYQYMQILKYFIWKEDNSQLLSYIENAGQKDEEDDENWTIEIR